MDYSFRHIKHITLHIIQKKYCKYFCVLKTYNAISSFSVDESSEKAAWCYKKMYINKYDIEFKILFDMIVLQVRAIFPKSQGSNIFGTYQFLG